MRHHHHRTDHNQAAIAKALRELGCKVLDLSGVGKGCPDLLALLPTGELQLIEVKNREGRNRLTTAQAKLMEAWPVAILRTVEDAQSLLPPPQNNS